ncbi:ABC transporter ATP-binding protein [Halorubrum sp. DM2]|uniref:ABC transporter ATP-binding protein n=1 Tax=Halorubrum sp. DM2 TaxID=2527867 RepID=UPI0024B7B3BE|nr:ABC transporter ATP-binding protein [Halorubrum sp. DM2]VTT87353.1 ABC transporter ATP-binding protein [Halorubrum sp. DM2]
MSEPSTPTSSDSAASRAIVCTDVTQRYDGDSGLFASGGRTVTALDGVSLAVDDGEVVGIAGPSGSGKSTLLHVLAGLATPTEGSVEIRGTDLATLSRRRRTAFRSANLGMVFQRFHLLPALTARENVALPLVQRGVPRGRRRDRASELLDAVGLADREAHRPGTLSGGEQQRVAIARALAADPAVVIADEPTGELDHDTGERVLDLLTEISDDRAVVIASHDAHALDRTDRVVRLLDGSRES